MKTAKEVRARCIKDPESGHLIWQGRVVTKKDHVYPVVCYQGHNRQVARIAYESKHACILARSDVLRRVCGEERCVAPEHYKRENVASHLPKDRLHNVLVDTRADYDV